MRSGLIRRFVLGLLALVSAASIAHADEGESPHIKAKLVSQSPAIAQDGESFVALDYTAAPGWHTYWVNPGSTGLPPKFHWNLPDGFSAGSIQFPVPAALPDQGLVSYGYEGRTVLLIKLANRSRFGAGEVLPIKARVDFLVCKDVCIPESLDVATTVKIGAATKGPGTDIVEKALKALPVEAGVDGTIDVRDGKVQLSFKGTTDAARAALAKPQGAYFFPVEGEVLDPTAPQALDIGADGFTLRTKAGPAEKKAPCVQGRTASSRDVGGWPCTGDLTGVLKLSDGASFQVTARKGPPLPGTFGLGGVPDARTDTSLGGVFIAMGLAFVGGLILNLMPCVFPVLSMKLLSLAKAGADGAAARSESLVYAVGAVASFVLLALVLDVMHRLGASLGWGFQLQSPIVVAGLAVVMLLVALNMSGVFEVGQSLQGIGAGALDQKRPMLSAFLTGVLAVVVAAPCTAPFMATAIGVALAQGGLTNFAIFVALGVGFALPLVALTFLVTLVPGVAARLPKPGTWMDRLKLGLSLLMYGAVIWLVWVFAQQKGGLGGGLLLLALLLLTAMVLPFRLPRLARIGAAVVAAGLAVIAIQQSYDRFEAQWSADLGEADASENPKTYFSFDRLAQTRSAGQAVLIDMTAAWCVTCKVNEVGVLNTPEVAEALRKSNTVYMVGDWTNQDAEISRYLSLFGRSGVPLYVYYGPNNAAPKVLPQILNGKDMVKLLNGGK